VRESKGVIEVSEAVDLSPSTTHRIIRALVKMNYLAQDEDNKKYKIGMKLFSLAGQIMQNNTLGAMARPYLMELSDQVGETVHFCVIENFKTYLIERVVSKKNLTHTSNLGFKDDPHLSSFGKVLLANMELNKIDEYIEKANFVKLTENTIIDKDTLRKELEKVREQGYAVDHEEIEEGLFCIAAPIFNSEGKVAAAMSVSGPAFRVAAEFDRNLQSVQEAAKKISKAIGWKLLDLER